MQQFISKYTSIYKDLKKQGSRNKVVFLCLLMLGLVYSFGVVESKYYRYNWQNEFSHKTLLLIFLGFAIFCISILILSNSITFINEKKVKTFNYRFKHDFISRIKTEIPEIKKYLYNQKIHPQIFCNSKLFTTSFSDYIGDDWISGQYNNVSFELCELNVFRLFRHIFHGIFIKCKSSNAFNISQMRESDNEIKDLINSFEETYCTKVKTSIIGNSLFIAVELQKDFLECKNQKQINSIHQDFYLLKDLILLIKSYSN